MLILYYFGEEYANVTYFIINSHKHKLHHTIKQSHCCQNLSKNLYWNNTCRLMYKINGLFPVGCCNERILIICCYSWNTTLWECPSFWENETGSHPAMFHIWNILVAAACQCNNVGRSFCMFWRYHLYMLMLFFQKKKKKSAIKKRFMHLTGGGFQFRILVLFCHIHL